MNFTNSGQMDFCTRCGGRVLFSSSTYNVREQNYKTGEMTIHPHVCSACKQYIETHNAVCRQVSQFLGRNPLVHQRMIQQHHAMEAI